MSILSSLKSMYNDLTRSTTLEEYHKMLIKVIKRLEFNKTHVIDFLYLAHDETCLNIVKDSGNFYCEIDENNLTHFRSKDDSLAFFISHDFKKKGVLILGASEQLFIDINNQSHKFIDNEGYYFTNNELEEFEDFECVGSRIVYHKYGNPKLSFELIFKKMKYADVITIGMKLNF